MNLSKLIAVEERLKERDANSSDAYSYIPFKKKDVVDKTKKIAELKQSKKIAQYENKKDQKVEMLNKFVNSINVNTGDISRNIEEILKQIDNNFYLTEDEPFYRNKISKLKKILTALHYGINSLKMRVK